ncbi:MAG: SEL1-like repeat protein [Oceanospirillaceae bacterium]|nr:SEL1-like repeat protein [Oceanospirillaceae bacterium]
MMFKSLTRSGLLALVCGVFSAQAADAVTDNCLGAYAKQHYSAAAIACRMEAESGSAESAFTLAVLNAKGLGIPVDHGESVRWLTLAAEAGHDEAAYNLAMAYTQGDGITADIAQAVAWFTRSASAGNAKAQRDLATLYARGFGVEKDPMQAFLLYKASAEQGVVVSQLQTGLMLLRGEGVEKDSEEASRWLEKAAKAGDGIAQYTLGLLLSDSQPGASANWYRKASAQGNGYAMHNLSLFYLHGRGVKQNYSTALNWAEKSIAAGVSESKGLQQQILQQMGDKQPAAHQYVVVRDHAWLDGKPNEDYLIQISRQPTEKAAYGYLKKHRVTGPVGIYRETLPNQTSYIVTYGDYRDITSAKAAISRLPESVQKFKPWVRSYENLKQAKADSPAAQSAEPASIAAESRKEEQVVAKSQTKEIAVQTGRSYGLKSAAWLLEKPTKGIAVQLMAMPSNRLREIQRYLKRHGLEKDTVYYETQRDAGPYMVVLLAREFTTTSAARASVRKLPSAVQRSKPWVRPFGALQSKYRSVTQNLAQ